MDDNGIADNASLENLPKNISLEVDHPGEMELNPTQSGNVGFRRAAEKVRGFPQTPGVYLMKDAAGL